jgi:hypothetical protein
MICWQLPFANNFPSDSLLSPLRSRSFARLLYCNLVTSLNGELAVSGLYYLVSLPVLKYKNTYLHDNVMIDFAMLCSLAVPRETRKPGYLARYSSIIQCNCGNSTLKSH